MKKFISIFFIIIAAGGCVCINAQSRATTKFNNDWKFSSGDEPAAIAASFNDAPWRSLNLPHDWSIEFPFDNTSHTGTGGALRGGIGWYRKTFTLPEADKSKNIFIDFDGVYTHSEVFFNGHSLGIRPNGYISF